MENRGIGELVVIYYTFCMNGKTGYRDNAMVGVHNEFAYSESKGRFGSGTSTSLRV